MIYLILIQLIITWIIISTFNKFAYNDWTGEKAYMCRALQIFLYLLSLVPFFIIPQIFAPVFFTTEWDYDFNFDKYKDKQWYKWLFENPYEQRKNC